MEIVFKNGKKYQSFTIENNSISYIFAEWESNADNHYLLRSCCN